jgi:hypothetical protein
MFDKEIEFSAHEDYFLLKEDYPTTIKLNIPEWYKKLEHKLFKKTAKGCMPFLNTLTYGYLLKMPQDFYVRHNIDNDSHQRFGMHEHESDMKYKKININTGLDTHSISQLEGSPHVEKNKHLPFYKILNPWKIKTPKGYSCLFVSPLNNSDDRFSIVPGIVDTDTFPNEINFPIVINGDKYPQLETIIEKGTPYVQVIPFKRDNWKMLTKPRKEKDIANNTFFYKLKLMNFYKNKFWNKVSWK